MEGVQTAAPPAVWIGRWTIVASILGSSMAFIDGSVVNVALPAIQHDLGGGLATQQWVVDAYLLTLGSLILVGGSLGDIFGEVRMRLGGWLIGLWSWRAIFLINVPIALATVVLIRRHVPQRASGRKPVRVDFVGATLCAIGLG